MDSRGSTTGPHSQHPTKVRGEHVDREHLRRPLRATSVVPVTTRDGPEATLPEPCELLVDDAAVTVSER